MKNIKEWLPGVKTKGFDNAAGRSILWAVPRKSMRKDQNLKNASKIRQVITIFHVIEAGSKEMIISGVERLRRAISWTVTLMAVIVILFSKPPGNHETFYETVEWIGYIFIVVATLGRIWCAVYIGGRKDEELTTDGPYSICRNPLYVFSFFGVVGVLLAAQNLPLLVITIPLFWGYYFFVITSEERRLKHLFGRQFEDYTRTVNRVIPRLKNFWSRDTIEVKPRLIFRSMMDAMWFMWFFMILELIEYLKTPGLQGKSILPIFWNLPF